MIDNKLQKKINQIRLGLISDDMLTQEEKNIIHKAQVDYGLKAVDNYFAGYIDRAVFKHLTNKEPTE